MSFEIGDTVFELSNGVMIGDEWRVTGVDGDQIEINRRDDQGFMSSEIKTVSSAELVKDHYLEELEEERESKELDAGLQSLIEQHEEEDPLEYYDKAAAEAHIAEDDFEISELDKEIELEEETGANINPTTGMNKFATLVIAGAILATVLAK